MIYLLDTVIFHSCIAMGVYQSVIMSVEVSLLHHDQDLECLRPVFCPSTRINGCIAHNGVGFNVGSLHETENMHCFSPLFAVSAGTDDCAEGDCVGLDLILLHLV